VTLQKPYWKSRGGSMIDTSSMSRVAALKVAELEPYVAETTNQVTLRRRELEGLEKELVEARKSLEYWRTMKAIAAEIDERLESGEEVSENGNSTEVG
jgi:flagellar biosynthesis chaperone FliJ